MILGLFLLLWNDHGCQIQEGFVQSLETSSILRHLAMATGQSEQEHELHELLHAHQVLLRHFIAVICPNRDAVDDILQDTNRVIWEKRNEFETGTNFGAWARRIAQFQTMSYLKTSTRKSWLHFDTELVGVLAHSFEQQSQSVLEEKKNALQECVGKLSPKDQELVALRYSRKWGLQRVGAQVGRSEGALKQVFRRIRKQLKNCMETRIHRDV